MTGALLPTGRPRDEITLDDGRTVAVSVVDAGNPTVFVPADALGMSGSELPGEIEARRDVTDALEEIRSIVAEWLGIVPDRRVATASSPGLPKVGFVAAPREYLTTTGERVPAGAADVAGRLMSMQTAHRSYMVTGAICTAAAAFIEHSVVHDITRPAGDRPDSDTIRIAHPYGVMDAIVRAELSRHPIRIDGVSVGRTARHILDGVAWVPEELFAATVSSLPAGAA